MQSIALVIHVALAIGLIGLVLIQHGKGADAGAAFGSGASATVFGARGSASFMTRMTTGVASAFFLTSLILFYLAANRDRGLDSVTDLPGSVVEEPADAATPDEPAGDLPGGVEEETDAPSSATPAEGESDQEMPAAPEAAPGEEAADEQESDLAAPPPEAPAEPAEQQ